MRGWAQIAERARLYKTVLPAPAGVAPIWVDLTKSRSCIPRASGGETEERSCFPIRQVLRSFGGRFDSRFGGRIGGDTSRSGGHLVLRDRG